MFMAFIQLTRTLPQSCAMATECLKCGSSEPRCAERIKNTLDFKDNAKESKNLINWLYVESVPYLYIGLKETILKFTALVLFFMSLENLYITLWFISHFHVTMRSTVDNNSATTHRGLKDSSRDHSDMSEGPKQWILPNRRSPQQLEIQAVICLNPLGTF